MYKKCTGKIIHIIVLIVFVLYSVYLMLPASRPNFVEVYSTT